MKIQTPKIMFRSCFSSFDMFFLCCGLDRKYCWTEGIDQEQSLSMVQLEMTSQMFLICQGRDNNSNYNYYIIRPWLEFNMTSWFNFIQKYTAMASLKYLNITSKFSQRDFQNVRPELGLSLLLSIQKKKQERCVCLCYYQRVYQRMIQSIISTENQTYGQYYSGIRWPHNHMDSIKYIQYQSYHVSCCFHLHWHCSQYFYYI